MLLPHIHRLQRPRVGSGRRSGRPAGPKSVRAASRARPRARAPARARPPAPRRAPAPRRPSAPCVPAALRAAACASQCPAEWRPVGCGRGLPELTSARGPRMLHAGGGPGGPGRAVTADPEHRVSALRRWGLGAAFAAFLLGAAPLFTSGVRSPPPLNCSWRGKRLSPGFHRSPVGGCGVNTDLSTRPREGAQCLFTTW